MKSNFGFLGQGRILNVQFPVIVAVVLFVILLFLYRRMKFGRHILALGSSEESVRVSGLHVDKLRIKVYALSGVIAALAGILLASRLTTVQPEMGKNYELEALVAVIIGGTSLAGGKGSLTGTVLGTLILFLIKKQLESLKCRSVLGNDRYRRHHSGCRICEFLGRIIPKQTCEQYVGRLFAATS